MEFWGAEIKPGKPLKVTPDEEDLIHISQAALGEAKKIQKGESVHLFAKVGEQKFVLGTLSHENFPQINFDLVFEKEFELSHNWKNGSVHFIGYKSPNIDEEDECFSDASDEEELPVTAAENGKAKAVEIAKPAKEAAAKPKAQAAVPTKKVESDSEEDDSDDDDEDEDDESDSEEGMDVDEDSDADSEDEDEETPKKVEQSKKRANESASKTPIPAKKAKAATPQKTDGKKGGHTATPYPAKKGGKTSPFASQSPKSGGQFSHGKNKNRGGK